MNARFDARSQPAAPLIRLGWVGLNAVQLIFTLVWSVACISLALLVYAATGSQRGPLAMARRLWAPGLLLGAGARLRVEGAEAIDWSKPYVIVANHQSMIDVCVLFRGLPVPLRFLLKQELTRVPFLGWYTRAMGMIGIERGVGRSAASSVEQAAALVRAGATLATFPEGTRGQTGTVGPFKGGAFHIAIAAQAPILPVAIIDAGRVLPPSGFKVRPGTITMRVGAPIATAGFAPADRIQLAGQARSAVRALMYAAAETPPARRSQ